MWRIGWELCTCTTLYFKFRCRLCTTTTCKCLIKISCLLEDENKWHQFSFSLPVLWYNPLGFIKFLSEYFAKNLTKRMTRNNGDEVCNTVNSRFCRHFNIDDGDGSENVTFKMNSRFLKLCRIYSNSKKLSNLSEFPCNWFLGFFSSLERDREIHCLVFVSFIKRENRHFHVVVVQWPKRNLMYKNAWCLCKVVVLPI